MKRLLPRRLRTFLPLLLLGATLLFSLVSAVVVDISDRTRLLAALEEHMRSEASRLAHLAEVDLGRDPMRVEREVMLQAAERWNEYAALIDPDGMVRYASRLDWVGRPAQEVVPGFDAALFSTVTGGIEPCFQRHGLRLIICFPYAYPPGPGELGSGRRGVIYLGHDASQPLAEARLQNMRNHLPLLLLGLLIVIAFTFWMDRRVARPLKSLLLATRRVVEGDLGVRVGRQGAFELAELTATFDRMVEWLGRETRQLREQRDFDRALLQALPALVVAVDGEGRILLANHKVAELLGRAPEGLEGQSFPLLAQHADPALKPLLQRLHAGELNEADGIEAPLESAQGVEHWVIWSLRRVDGMVLAVGEDVTARREAEARQRLAQTVFDHLDETLLITDAEQRIIAVNPAFTRIMGYTEEEVLGKTPVQLKSGMHDAEYYRRMWDSLNTSGQWQGEMWDRRKDGALIPLWMVIFSVRDEHEQVQYYVANATDLTALKQAQARGAWLAEHDALTGLLNRVGFIACLRGHLAQVAETGRHGIVLVLKLNRLKSINEGRGPQWGDALLTAVAERLKHALGMEQELPSDRPAAEDIALARVEADEFAILLPPKYAGAEAAIEQALHTAESLRLALALPIVLDQTQVDALAGRSQGQASPRAEGQEALEEAFLASASIGIALYPVEAEANEGGPQDHAPGVEGESEEVLRRAYLAMRAATARGGSRIEFFEHGMSEQVRTAFDLEHAMERALSGGEGEQPFRLFLQPQVDAAGRLCGFEALLRFIDPERGMIPPVQFIPIAERSGMIVQLGDWVLDCACRFLAQLARAGRRLSIAVNVSPRQFGAEGFVNGVVEAISRHGADPGLLVLEVTEGLVIDNPERTISIMHELARHGVHFSIDDFGTGYSSLSYLKRLPIHELKIDRSFISGLPQDEDDAVIVDTIIAMARHLHLRVVAEGVETEAQAAFLRQHGEVLAQGYLFGRPAPAQEWITHALEPPPAGVQPDGPCV